MAITKQLHSDPRITYCTLAWLKQIEPDSLNGEHDVQSGLTRLRPALIPVITITCRLVFHARCCHQTRLRYESMAVAYQCHGAIYIQHHT